MKNNLQRDKWLKEKPSPMWEGRFDQQDDLPDGAWWAACEADLGGYELFKS